MFSSLWCQNVAQPSVEVLRNLAHDADDFALPRFEQRCILLDEVQQVLLRLFREALVLWCGSVLANAARQGAPQVIDLALRISLAVTQLGQLLRQALAAWPAVAVDAVIGQGVAAVDEALNCIEPMFLFA